MVRSILTAGQRNGTLITSFALFPNREFFAQATLFWGNQDQQLAQHFSTNLYAKYMFYQNDAASGGGGVFLGMGKSPSYFSQNRYVDMHKNYWTAVAVTIPFLESMISWDIMPGRLVDFEGGDNNSTAWGFTYSTRLAVYRIIPQSALVGEIYGTVGEAYSKPEFKVGIRWEPNTTVVPAITYGAALDGTNAAGLEIGVMIFSPQFLKL